MRWLCLLVLASCGRNATSRAPQIGDSVESRGAPAPFLDVPGLTQVATTRTTYGDFGSTSVTRIQVLRGGRAVCEVEADSRSGHENHSSFTTAALAIHTRTPLQFEVRRFLSSAELIGDDIEICTRYELGSRQCTKLVERQCAPYSRCAPKITSVTRPGTGRLAAVFTHDGEAFVGSTARIDETTLITDERGAVDHPAGPGRHLVWLSRIPTPIEVSVPSETGDVALTVALDACSCCN